MIFKQFVDKDTLDETPLRKSEIWYSEYIT